MKHDIDTGLISSLLRSHGHTVGHVIPTPDNAGEFEFEVDGNLLSLAEVRGLLEMEDERKEVARHSGATHSTTAPANGVATP